VPILDTRREAAQGLAMRRAGEARTEGREVAEGMSSRTMVRHSEPVA
jgi:hypothetical protein